MKDVAIIGKAGAGKDTVAQLLDELAPGFIRLAFADPVKAYYHSIFMSEPPEPKPRAGYQWFGQKMREHDPDVWIKHLAETYNSITEWTSNPVIITDLRQPNEYEWCRKNGFVIVKVWATEETRIERLKKRGDNFKLEDLNHETERYIDEFKSDFWLDNDEDDIDYLKKQITKLVGFLNRQE